MLFKQVALRLRCCHISLALHLELTWYEIHWQPSIWIWRSLNTDGNNQNRYGIQWTPLMIIMSEVNKLFKKVTEYNYLSILQIISKAMCLRFRPMKAKISPWADSSSCSLCPRYSSSPNTMLAELPVSRNGRVSSELTLFLYPELSLDYLLTIIHKACSACSE